MTRSEEGKWSTGVAIASVGSPVIVRLTLRNERGEPVAGGQAAFGLSANRHVSRFLEELFPDADLRKFQGTLTVTVEGGSIVGTAIQIGSRAGLFVALPAAELR